MSYRKFNLSILENIVNTQYGDFGGLVQIDRSDLYSFSELCKEKGIDMEKYFLLGMHFGTSSLTNVGNDDSFYCFALVGYFGVTVPLISVKQCHFERSYNYIKN